MRAGVLLLVCLAGCAQPEWPHYGGAADQVVVRGVTIKALMEVVEEVFREHGYEPAPGTNPQEPDMVPRASVGRAVMAFVRGGQSTVRVFAVPQGDGWSVVAASGPDGMNTFYPQASVRAILREVGRRVNIPVRGGAEAGLGLSQSNSPAS
jgi:hypothetical protein